MDKPKLSIVIPVYNEEAVLAETLLSIERYVKTTALPFEIIVVDDGSSDGTWDLVRNIAQSKANHRGIRLSKNFGKESAIATGLAFALGEGVIVMDGDGQHPPELIPEMVKRWQQGFDVVEAVKEVRGKEPIVSLLGAKLFYWLMRHLTGMNLDDASDFKLLDRKVVDAHNRLPETSRFFRGIIAWIGFRKSQVPFSVKERLRGRSRWSIPQLVRLAVNASTAFSSLPLHFVTITGFLIFFVSLVLGLQTLYMKFSGAAVSGFTTVILLLLFLGSALMLSLGIIGIYISRIFEEVKRRPIYIIDDTTNLVGSRE